LQPAVERFGEANYCPSYFMISGPMATLIDGWQAKAGATLPDRT
jgi:hypothetical protein